MSDYCVEVAYNLHDLVKQVNVMIQAGYKPIGGMMVVKKRVNLEMQFEYTQAMFKEAK